jgi:uncharacterized membrane protein YeaQ/YmgE (transglycosylase-associated protein family)
MKKKFQKWYLAFMGAFALVGSILGLTIMYIIKRQFNFSALLGSLTGASILIIINLIIVFLRKDKTS